MRLTEIPEIRIKQTAAQKLKCDFYLFAEKRMMHFLFNINGLDKNNRIAMNAFVYTIDNTIRNNLYRLRKYINKFGYPNDEAIVGLTDTIVSVIMDIEITKDKNEELDVLFSSENFYNEMIASLQEWYQWYEERLKKIKMTNLNESEKSNVNEKEL